MANPILGVAYHWAGGLASASFYLPYYYVRQWSWEVLWITGGIVSWLLAPWAFAEIWTGRVPELLAGVPPAVLVSCFLFGALWGVGGLTFGLTLRHLGISLGMTVALGFTMVFGTLVPPIADGTIGAVLATPAGAPLCAGITIALAGVAAVAVGGARKHADGSPKGNLRRGLWVAVLSGTLSSCFAFGLAMGEPIRAAARDLGAGPLWRGLPVLCVVLAGGFATNLIWSLVLILRRGSSRQWVIPPPDAQGRRRVSLLAMNYALCAASGLVWYLQFFFYTMGESQMGRFRFTSWALHMASIIAFSCLWGVLLGEWKAAPASARRTAFAGVALLIGATLLIGWGNAHGA